MKTGKITALAVLFIFASTLVYGAEEQGLWQRLRNKFSPKKESVKPAAAVKQAPIVKQAPVVKPAAAVERSEMTVDELVADITENLDSEDEILTYVQELKKTVHAEGKVVYTLGGIPLKDAKKADLVKLSEAVAQAAVRIRTERIQAQLETVRQAQGLARQQVMQRPPAPPVQPPRPPQSPASNLPRVPAAPPAPPKR